MAERSRVSAAPKAAALFAAALALAQCPTALAAQSARRAAQDYAEFLELLAGRYDTTAQSRAEADAAGPPREAVQRVVAPVRAGFIGDTVYYVHESIAADGRRLIGQQLSLFSLVQGSTLIVETPIAFNEPRRWREGDRNPELFRSILPQDVKALAGCEVVWRKVAGGFDGATDPARCRSSAGGGAAVRVERRYALRSAGLTVQEKRFDEAGRPVAEEAPLQYQRQLP
jgi:hypothetical protein